MATSSTRYKTPQRRYPDSFYRFRKMPPNTKDPQSPKTPQKETNCDLCCDAATIFAVGPCNHPICHRCFVRLRVLAEDPTCSVCRQPLLKPVLTRKPHLYESLSTETAHYSRTLDAYAQDKDISRACCDLLDHRCPFCDFHANTFTCLKRHVRSNHNLHYCKLCEKNLTLFSAERAAYTREELARHQRRGGATSDDSSHKGHPLCRFCDVRYFDNDDLFAHLRKDHYFCYICDKDGVQDYYRSIVELKAHCKAVHYVCEIGQCVDEPFTSIFRNEMLLKAHVAKEHSKGKEARSARVLTVEVSFNDRDGSGTSAFSMKDEERNERLGRREERPPRMGRGKDKGKKGIKSHVTNEVEEKMQLQREGKSEAVRNDIEEERLRNKKAEEERRNKDKGKRVTATKKESTFEKKTVNGDVSERNVALQLMPGKVDENVKVEDFDDAKEVRSVGTELVDQCKDGLSKEVKAEKLKKQKVDQKIKVTNDFRPGEVLSKDFPSLTDHAPFATDASTARSALLMNGFARGYNSWRPYLGISEADFPSLRPSAPPGLQKPIKTAPPPPGFKSVQPTSLDSSSNFQTGAFPMAALLQVLKNDKSKIESLKVLSGSFLREQLSAEDYCVHCCELLGEERFDSIFEWLVDSLPNPRKKAELLRVREDTKSLTANSKWVSVKKVSYVSEFPALPGKVSSENNREPLSGPWRKV